MEWCRTGMVDPSMRSEKTNACLFYGRCGKLAAYCYDPQVDPLCFRCILKDGKPATSP
jgi:hypothetical protein